MAANIAVNQPHILISRVKTPENTVIYGFPYFIKHAAEERNLDIAFNFKATDLFGFPTTSPYHYSTIYLRLLKEAIFFAAKLRQRPLPETP